MSDYMPEEYHRPYLTVSLPCYKRPQRTLRAIESVLAQTYRRFELVITVDGDPELMRFLVNYLFPVNPLCRADIEFNERLIKGDVGGITKLGGVTVKSESVIKTDSSAITLNKVDHRGHWGTAIRNRDIQLAVGRYFLFMGNDDVMLPNHLENYLSQIEHTDLDFVAFDSYVEPNNAPRNTQFQEGMIGHSELIVRTEFLRSMPPHEPVYGHDWTLVKNMMAASGKYKKAVGAPQTYIVKSIPGKPEHGID